MGYNRRKEDRKRSTTKKYKSQKKPKPRDDSDNWRDVSQYK